MPKKKLTTHQGFTITELMVATVISVIVISGISVLLVDGQRGWNAMYNLVYSDVVTDGYVARKSFDSVMRKASREKYLLEDGGSWIEIYYYADDDSSVLDRYARFFKNNSELNIEYGRLEPRETLDIQTICSNVSRCTFKAAGQSAQMTLTLDDGSQTITVVSSAVMHNK